MMTSDVKRPWEAVCFEGENGGRVANHTHSIPPKTQSPFTQSHSLHSTPPSSSSSSSITQLLKLPNARFWSRHAVQFSTTKHQSFPPNARLHYSNIDSVHSPLHITHMTQKHITLSPKHISHHMHSIYTLLASCIQCSLHCSITQPLSLPS